MISAAQVLAVLLELTPCWADRHRPPAEEAQRLEVIATGVSVASNETTRPIDTAAMLIALGYHESKLCHATHAGTVKGGDGEGLWQLEPGSRRVRPFSGLSLEATTHAATQAAWLVRHSYSCGTSPRARFTQIGFGSCPGRGWPTLEARVRTYWWAFGLLQGAKS